MSSIVMLPKRSTLTSMNRRKAIGAAIQRIREGAGIDRSTAASRAGVSVYTWQRWESGVAAIPMDRVADIARALTKDPIADKAVRAELKAAA